MREEKEKPDSSKSNKKYKLPKFLRVLARIFLGILILFVLLVLFVRSPWGQNIIVTELTQYVSNKTNTRVEIDRLFITFAGDIALEGLFLDDKQGDTLVYAKSLEADIPIWPLISGGDITVDAVDLVGLRANIIRKDTLNGFNFQFLFDALATAAGSESNTEQADSSYTQKIKLGDFDLREINVVFNDDVSGIESSYIIGELLLEMEETNIEAMNFKAEKLLLKNSSVHINQKPPNVISEEASVLPVFSISETELEDVTINFKSKTEDLLIDLHFNELNAEDANIDLGETDYALNSLELSDSSVLINTALQKDTSNQFVEALPESTNSNTSFSWPSIRLNIGEIDFRNNNLSFISGSTTPNKESFNPNAIQLSSLDLEANSFLLDENTAGINLESTSFDEVAGINIKELALNAKIDDSELILDKFNLAFNDNRISGNLKIDYPTINDFIKNPERSKVDLDIPDFRFNIKDLFKFQPSLMDNPYLVTLAEKNLNGSLKASGVLSLINLDRVTVNWGLNTQVAASGSIENVTNPDLLMVHLSNLFASTIKSDVNSFIDENRLGINLPEKLTLTGKLNGSTRAIDTDLLINSTMGSASIVGNFESGDNILFNADVLIEDFQLQSLLNNERLGAITMTLDASGMGKDINNLNADMEAVIRKFQLNNYPIEDLKILGSVKNGEGTISSKYKDQNLNLEFQSYVKLDSMATEANIKLNLIGADLQSLGVSTRNIRTGFVLNADFKGDFKKYDVSADLNEGVVVYDNKSYLIGNINAAAHIRPDTTSIDVKNKLLDFNLQSNTDPQTFSMALKDHVYSYFYRDVILSDTIKTPVNVKFDGHISRAPILSEVFFVNLKDLDTIDIDVDFAQSERRLSAEIHAPLINYSNVKIDSLDFSMNTDREKFIFDLRFNEINAGPVDIEKTEIIGNQIDNELDLRFLAYHKGEEMIKIASQISGTSDDLRLHIVPDSLLINKQKWDIPQDNEIRYLVDKLRFNQFKFSRNNQSVEFRNDEPDYPMEHVAIDFINFNLSEFLDYLNPNKELAKGTINGDLVFEKPLTDPGIIADLEISELDVMDVDMGNLRLNGKSLGGNAYSFNLGISGGEVDLKLDGNYVTDSNEPKIDLDLGINEIKMSALKGFSMGAITNGSGSINGNFKLNGTLLDPSYEGFLNFNNADFTVAALNVPFSLPNETISVNNEGISMENFTLVDENDNTLVVSGLIATENFINPTFDLEIKANNFRALNASEEDNDIAYGLAVFDAEATINGDLQIPVIRGNLEVSDETNITYVVPTATVNIEEREGVVVFVNRENPDAILTRSEEQTGAIKGFDVQTTFKVNKDATLTILIDKESGDNFKVSGEGEFDFRMLPNGRISLAGVYNISGGHYEMHLYNLVNRTFLLADDSKIRWSGDPFDAELDIRAIYEIETSASDLMAARTAGSDIEDRTQFRQVLPFYVYLNVDGQLMSPKISFALDMPEDEQGAIGGEVYGQLQEINNQEAELNKQVFSLLVLNKFYPDAGSDGSRGGFATIARDNLNDALSDQLNVFSDKLLGDTGLELDFSLDTFTDYQGESPQERTQLDIAAQKRLFDDRVTVSVGSEVDVQGSDPTGESTPLIGNVSLEYIITKDGRYKIRGFRKNEFESVIDGQTIVSGIALIFTQEFNKFNELWNALFKSKTKEEKLREAEIEKAEKKLEEKEIEINPKNDN